MAGKTVERKAYEAAVLALEDNQIALQMLEEEHPKLMQRLKQLLNETAELTDNVKSTAKELAAQDPTFNRDDCSGFYFDLVRSRSVDVPTLEEILGKPVTKVKGLANVKVSVNLDTVETLVRAGKLPDESLNAIKTGGLSCSLKQGKRDED